MSFFDYLDKRETKNKKVIEVKKAEKIVENKKENIEEKQVIKEDNLVNHVNLILGGVKFEPGKIELTGGDSVDHLNALLS
jgi:hypothetical protein